MDNIEINTQQVVNIDRPDIVKGHGSSHITFKEVKDALFKLFMQVGIKFVSFEKLPVPIDIKSKIDGSVRTSNNIMQYTVTCRLQDIYVNGKPVYIVALPTNQYDLDKRHHNKLIYMKRLYNIIIFDEEDCKKLGLSTSDQAWIKSLSKALLKRWIKLLFSKISELGEEVESGYNLNEIYKKIDTSVTDSGKGIAGIVALKQEGLTLKYKILKNKLEYLFPNLKAYPEDALNYLAKIDKDSSEWLEEIFTYTLNQIIGKIDLRRNIYKDFFRLKKGEIDVANREKISLLIQNKLENKFNIDITNLGYGALRIQDKKTFQTIFLIIDPTKSNNTRGITINSNLLKKISSETFHCLNLTFNKTSGKLKKAKGYLFASEKGNFEDYKKCRLQIFDSDKMNRYKIYLLD